MITRLARYKINESDREAVERAILEYLAAIAEHEPETFYESYRMEDGTTYLHLMQFPSESAEESHRQSAHTRRFVEILYPRCEEEPEFIRLTPIA